ncbi:PrgI family protein [Candidatus Kaiserbacteria bacterium]|nr:PrgI family protein [Candidatus Kaiserbacteria bacterium]
MRFEVPQFIEIEDKIIGPFTWKQFVYLAGGIGVAVVFFITFPLIISVLIGLPVAILALLLAFYPVNNRPFSVFLESIITFYKGTRLFYWRKQNETVYRGRTQISPTTDSPTISKIPHGKASGIKSLSHKLEMQSLETPK